MILSIYQSISYQLLKMRKKGDSDFYYIYNIYIIYIILYMIG